MSGRTPHILMVSQKVVDIKTPVVNEQVKRQAGFLWGYLNTYKFVAGNNKVSGDFVIIDISPAGTIHSKLSGSLLGRGVDFPGVNPAIELNLELDLKEYHGSHNIQDAFAAVPNAFVDDGGNVQNMFVDLLLLADTLTPLHPEFGPEKFKITIASSTDPLRRSAELNDRLQNRFQWFKLNIDDRNAVHLPFEWHGEKGTLSITSEPIHTIPSLLELLDSDAAFKKAFEAATCIVSSDPIYDVLGKASAPFAYIINASTFFRVETALRACGSDTLLPMNDKEAQEVIRLMLSRGRGVELDQIPLPHLPSPFLLSGDGLDPPALRDLDGSLDMHLRFNHIFRPADRLAFSCPISFGKHGGLIIGTNSHTVACFTSILSPEGENWLFDKYGLARTDSVFETGAGDGVAAVVALFNTVSPESILVPFMQGAEVDNSNFRLLACTIFVSAFSRVIGNLLVRTTLTNLSDRDLDTLAKIIDEVADLSVQTARRTLKLLARPTFAKMDRIGINVALWQPLQIAFPGGIPATY